MGKKRSGHKKAAKARDLSVRKGANVKGGWPMGVLSTTQTDTLKAIGDAVAKAARTS
jgi:hypothetical protein